MDDLDPLAQEFFRRCLALRLPVRIDIHLTKPFGRTAVRFGAPCGPDCFTFYFEEGKPVQLHRNRLSPMELRENVDVLVEEVRYLLSVEEPVT